MLAPLRALAFCSALFAAPLAGCDALTGSSGDASALPGDLDMTPTTAEACDGRLGEATVENVNVPSDATCLLDGTVVQGNVFVRSNARLVTRDVRVGGNIQAENSRLVQVLSGTRVGGNIQVNQGGATTIDRVVVDGDIQLEQNAGRQDVEGARVGGNMQVNQNSGGVFLNDNRVAENLQCQANEPAPVGSGNVAGDKEDQCVHV